MEQCQLLAAGLEASSEHPLAQALTALTDSPAEVQQLQAQLGMGFAGELQGESYRIGTYRYVIELTGDAKSNAKAEDVSCEQAAISTHVYLGSKKGLLAKFTLHDEIREAAKQAVQQLQKLGIKVSLLSGDNQQAVSSVATALGIEQAIAKLLPADKLNYLQNLQAQGEVVAMVGDGVNDAPVLAGADVSIAMGSGSQLAQASADMILLSENLSLLPSSISLSRRMQNIVHQNFAWAILYNIVAIPIAAMGLIAPWMAAIGMSLSSLVVVMNALRLKS